MEIILVRHAESTANTGETLPHLQGDHPIALTARGREQSIALAQKVSREIVESSLIYCSPFVRARETLDTFLNAHQLTHVVVHEDPLLREQDRGYESEESQMALRRIHGWFWYRHAGGESPADVYQRQCIFLDAMYREIARTEKQKILIVTHGMTLRCFAMRFLHLSVGEFERMRNPRNVDVIRIGPVDSISDPTFVYKQWAASGLKLRPADNPPTPGQLPALSSPSMG